MCTPRGAHAICPGGEPRGADGSAAGTQGRQVRAETVPAGRSDPGCFQSTASVRSLSTNGCPGFAQRQGQIQAGSASSAYACTLKQEPLGRSWRSGCGGAGRVTRRCDPQAAPKAPSRWAPATGTLAVLRRGEIQLAAPPRSTPPPAAASAASASWAAARERAWLGERPAQAGTCGQPRDIGHGPRSADSFLPLLLAVSEAVCSSWRSLGFLQLSAKSSRVFKPAEATHFPSVRPPGWRTQYVA